MRKQAIFIAACMFVVFCGKGVCAREIYVAIMGTDLSSGDKNSPLLTINKAAQIAKPGDTVIVLPGTYREWVKPVRGGTSENMRITYRAAPVGKVIVKGSERIRSWTHEGGGVWKVELANSFFGGYNPVGPNFYCYARICLNHTKKEYYEHRSKHPRDAIAEQHA